MAKEHKYWIDTIKAICMICVYIAHCEAFYIEGKHCLAFCVLPFYVNAFFFVNGYLIFGKFFRRQQQQENKFSVYKENITNIIFRLAIPTIIFSAIIYLPKNHWGFTPKNFAINVLGGTSLWFTSALCISQLAIYTLMLSKNRNIWFYTGLTAIIFTTIYLFGDVRSKAAEEYLPWYWQTGLLYTLLLCAGGLYYKYENAIENYVKRPITLAVIFLVFASLMIYSWNNSGLLCLGLSGRCNLLGATAIILSLAIITFVSKKIKHNNIISFIGKHSLLLYFFSGAIPSTILTIIKKLPFENSYIIFTLYLIVSFITSCIIALFIQKYTPYLLDIRKTKKSTSIKENGPKQT